MSSPYDHPASLEHERLIRAPEFPMLASVCSIVDIAVAVLKARHPFLAGHVTEDDVLEPQPIMLAQIVCLHAGALKSAIERYHDVMTPEGGIHDVEPDRGQF